jgi:endonuclease/exonuclease/phosphatase family metal-dependent hydrolase
VRVVIRRFFTVPLVIACMVVSISALVWRAADLIGVNAGWVTLGYSVAPWAALFAAALFVLSMLAKRVVGAQLMLFAGVMLISPFFPVLGARAPAAAVKSDTRVRVLSFNAWLDRNELETARAERVAAMIRAEKPDIIVFQEINQRNLTVVRDQLDGIYDDAPINMLGNGKYGFAVISRFGLELVDDTDEPTRVMRVVANTPSGPVAVWNVHAYRENLLGNDSLLAYPDGSYHRPLTEQSLWLVERAAQEEMPVVIAGDFNMPTFSPAYRVMSAPLTDVHSVAGEGIGFTFPANANHVRYQDVAGFSVPLSSPVPLSRIDHIFVSREINVLSSRVLADAAGSDHSPILTDLALR